MSAKVPQGARAGIARMEAADLFAKSGAEPVWQEIDSIARKLIERGQADSLSFPQGRLRRTALEASKVAFRIAEGPYDEGEKQRLAGIGVPPNRMEAKKARRAFDHDLASKAKSARAAIEEVISKCRIVADGSATHEPLRSTEFNAMILRLEAAHNDLLQVEKMTPQPLAPASDDFLTVFISNSRLGWRETAGAEPAVTRAETSTGCLFADFAKAVYSNLLGGDETRDLRRFIAEIGMKEGWSKAR
jgi:hypothetical protein